MKKYYIYILYSMLLLSCGGQNTSQKENFHSDMSKADAAYYEQKYENELKAFSKLLFEQYFSKLDTTKLKRSQTCVKQKRLLYPVYFKESIDSLTARYISFPGLVAHVSVIYSKKEVPYDLIWDSDMANYCYAQEILNNKWLQLTGTGITPMSTSGCYAQFLKDAETGAYITDFTFFADQYSIKYPIRLNLSFKDTLSRQK